MHWNALHHNRYHSRARRWSGKGNKGSEGFSYDPGNKSNHPEVNTMASCAFCGAELEPPVRARHKGYHHRCRANRDGRGPVPEPLRRW